MGRRWQADDLSDEMDDGTVTTRSLIRGPLGLPARAAAATLRPLSGAATAAVEAGIAVERQAVRRLLDSEELDYIVDMFFASGVLDRIVDELLESEALWRLVDEIAASPAVRDAITQQGLGFADQLAHQVRARSRHADGWLETKAHRRLSKK